MSALTAYAPWIAWAVVPSFATEYALKALYAVQILSRPSTQQHAIQQSARVRACLVGAYLLYLFYSNIANQEPSAYRLLGVDLDCNADQIKRAFRKLAIIYHPDKVGPQGERFFIALRRSHDVLSDPVKRFAYDRFGISVLDWKDALSYREHMIIGLRGTFAFYIINPLIFAVISWLHKDSSPFALWHFSLLFAFFSSELYLITTPERPALVQALLPRHTTHDLVLLFHQMYTSLVMAARQIFPLLASVSGHAVGPEPRNLKEAQALIAQMANQMEQLGALSNGMTMASSQALARDKAATLPEAAEAVASGSAGKTNGHLNTLEDTYVHLVGERLMLDVLRNREDVKELRLLQEKGGTEATQSAQGTNGSGAQGPTEGEASTKSHADATIAQA